MLKRTMLYAAAKKTSILVAGFALCCFFLAEQPLSTVPAAQEVQTTFLYLPDPGQAEPDTPSAARQPSAALDGEYPQADAQPFAELTTEPQTAQDSGFIYSEEIPLSRELQEYTYNTCLACGLEYEFVLALMWRESRFQVDAVNINTNGTQDSGIMQINDVNRDWLREQHGIDDLMDPRQNIEAGTIMLSTFVEKYGEHGALMAYQYGEAGMQAKLRQGIVTNEQIQQLVERRDHYRELLETT